jgi:hypothetical protein
MSRFYASIGGSAQTGATRQGTERSGIRGHVRGWNSGVKVIGFANDEGEDEFRVYVTGGSNGYTSDQLIGIVKGDEFTPAL